MREGTKTEHGIFARSPAADLDRFASVINGLRFLDIGSGDGRIVERATQLGAQAWGVEIDKGLYLESVMRHRIIHDDVFNLDLKSYDILYYYLGGCARESELFYKILTEFRGYTILYSG